MNGASRLASAGLLTALCFVCACSGKSAAESSAAPPVAQTPCRTPSGTRTLVADGVTGLAVVGDQVVVMGETLVRVPLAGGDPVTLATPESGDGLLVVNGVAYFEASHPAGDPIGGKQPTEQTLDAVPVAGGDVTTVLASGNAPLITTSAADADSLYFDAFGTVTRFTPPASTTQLTYDRGLSVDAIAVVGDYVYIAAQDILAGGFQNGVIERIPKQGGAARKLLSGLGHPWSLVADASGLYWAEDPPGFDGQGHIARAGLDGENLSVLVPTSATALALASKRLYFSTGDSIASVAISGGAVTTLESGLKSAGMLAVAGDNLIWLDPATKALSDPTVPAVLTACISNAPSP